MSKKIFRPNVDDLQTEWVDQPELIHNMSRIAVQKRNDMDVAKAAMELVEAELKDRIKKKPYKYGFNMKEKAPAQAAIDAAALKHEKFQQAQKEYFKARLEHGIAEAAVTAASTKKTALENLVVLWVRDFGGTPKVPREYSDEVADKIKKTALERFKVDDPEKKKRKKKR